MKWILATILVLSGCVTKGPHKNNLMKIHKTRKNDATVAVEDAVKTCQGPIKLIMIGVKETRHRRLTELSFRCQEVDPVTLTPDQIDGWISDVIQAENKIIQDGKTNFYKIDKDLEIKETKDSQR